MLHRKAQQLLSLSNTNEWTEKRHPDLQLIEEVRNFLTSTEEGPPTKEGLQPSSRQGAALRTTATSDLATLHSQQRLIGFSSADFGADTP